MKRYSANLDGNAVHQETETILYGEVKRLRQNIHEQTLRLFALLTACTPTVQLLFTSVNVHLLLPLS